MFQQITMLDYSRPLAARAAARKSCGPYTWRPSAPSKGRGFYQASNGLRMDPRGSTINLRLDLANDVLAQSNRLRRVDGYYCDNFQDGTLIPIIARLPHGRGFLAGWTMGAGMCGSLETDIWETAEEAAQAAHDEAERAAERERNYQAEEDTEDA